MYIVAVHFVEAIFNEGVYTWVLKIVTDGQTDSLNAWSFTTPTLMLSGQRHYGLLLELKSL